MPGGLVVAIMCCADVLRRFLPLLSKLYSTILAVGVFLGVPATRRNTKKYKRTVMVLLLISWHNFRLVSRKLFARLAGSFATTERLHRSC